MQNGSFNSTYTANNQLFGYAYDAAGNLLSNGLFSQMVWDAESRLASVGGATYLYDAEGNRVEKQGAGVTDTVYFGGQPVARYAGGAWTDLIYGPTGLLAEVPGTAAGQPSYRLTDNLGTDVGTLLANGTFVNAIDHTPFGQVISGATSDPYFFTGKERDTESGLDYFGARYYASNMGRWMSPDWSAKEEPVPYAKLDNPQTLNMYAYVGNNPLGRADADGHCWPQWVCTALQGASASVGTQATQDAAARRAYNAGKAALEGAPKGDPVASAARTALKIDARNASSPTGKTIAEIMRPIADEGARVGGTASKGNAGVDAAMGVAGKAGPVLMAVGVAVSVYEVSTSDNKPRAIAGEGGGWAGALALGGAGGSAGAEAGQQSVYGSGVRERFLGQQLVGCWGQWEAVSLAR